MWTGPLKHQHLSLKLVLNCTKCKACCYIGSVSLRWPHSTGNLQWSVVYGRLFTLMNSLCRQCVCVYVSAALDRSDSSTHAPLSLKEDDRGRLIFFCIASWLWLRATATYMRTAREARECDALHGLLTSQQPQQPVQNSSNFVLAATRWRRDPCLPESTGWGCGEATVCFGSIVMDPTAFLGKRHPYTALER